MSEKNKNIETEKAPKPLSSKLKTVALIALLAAMGWMMLKSHLFKPELYKTGGDTMGTKYHVIVCADSGWGWERTATAIENELVRVNGLMSTFIPDSEISKFNDNPSTDWIEVSPEMVKMVKLSKEASKIVDGKFDITVGPLVDLWGFGKKPRKLTAPPAPADIAMTQLACGLDKIDFQENPPALKKKVPGLRIDLSGVAKGYGVDCVAKVLGDRGYKNYMIEIGGETRTRGHKVVLQDKKSWFSAEKQSLPWYIGVEQPTPVEMFEMPTVALKINLNDHAMATSGDARNYHEIGGQHYTHIIDPVTGEALTPEQLGTGVDGEETGSVSVIADTCAEADSLATGFFLLDVRRGIETADRNELAVAYLIRTDDPNNPIRVVMSEAFKKNYAPAD